MSTSIPEISDELYDAINSGTAQVTRRIEVYESDGITQWKKDTPPTIKDGQVTVNYGNDEERRGCDFTFNNEDGVMDHGPQGFWYDKILKPFRGIKYQRPESYETTVKVKVPLAFWRVADNNSLFEHMMGAVATTHPDEPVEVVTSHNAHWDKYDQAARFHLFANVGFKTNSTMEQIVWPTSSFTVEAWVRPRTTESINKTIVRIGNFSMGLLGADNSIFVRSYRDSTFVIHDFNDKFIQKEGLGGWFHVAIGVTNNITNGTSDHSLYINGTFIKTDTLTGVVVNDSADWASFGYDGFFNSGWGNNDIADIAVYGYELTEAELFENYSVGTDDRIVVREWETQIGEFMIDSINADHFPKSVKVTGRDYTKKLIKIKFNEAVTFTSGTNLDTVVEAVARNGGITKFRLGSDSYALESDASFDRTTERWAAIKDMCDATGVEVFFDAQGYLTTRPFLDPTTSPESIVLRVGTDGNLNSYSYTSNDSRIYNKIIVTGENPDDMEEGNLYSGTAANSNPFSPTSIQALGERTYFHSSALFTSDEQCRRFANELLKVNALEEVGINFASLVFAWLDVGEIVRVNVAESQDSIPDRYLLTSLTIPFTLSVMTGTGKRIVAIEDPFPFPGLPNGDQSIDGGRPLFIDPIIESGF